jgi:putative glutamine amidotransferase
MKPIIGVMPLWDEKKDSLWMLPGYLDGIALAGGIPVIFPFTSDEDDIARVMSGCGGFLLTGGHDVSPGVYGEEPLEGLVDCCEKRDVLEGIVLKRAIAEDRPVLGICRGIQFINAALGGTLYQDLPTQHPSDVIHRQQPPYDVPSHVVHVVPDSPLHRYLGTDMLRVNSSHHQAIKELAPGLEVMATSPDGLVEAVYMPGRSFIWAVQWHPERLFLRDQNNVKIFRALVEAAK